MLTNVRLFSSGDPGPKVVVVRESLDHGCRTDASRRKDVSHFFFGNFHEGLNHHRIKLRSAILNQSLYGVIMGKPTAIATIGNHRVVGIDDRYNTRSDRYLFALQPRGIALSIKTLVVVEGIEASLLKARKQAQDRPAILRMFVHQLAFVIRQLTFLFQDRVGNADFADVVQQGGDFKLIQIGLRNSQLARDAVDG